MRGSSASFFPSSAKLRFLSLVEVASIPLHLATGPSLSVWTSSELTEQWISEALLDNWDAEVDTDGSIEPWWLRSIQQSDRGILLQVEDAVGAIHSVPISGPKITEVLIYAGISKERQDHAVLPTPPGSSSPGRGEDPGDGRPSGIMRDIKIYALPLCSREYEELDNGQDLDSRSLQSISVDGEACFLPMALENFPAPVSLPRQRSKLYDLFDDARHQRKRLIRHGGGGVPKVMSTMDGPVLQHERSNSGGVKSTPLADQLKDISQIGASRGILSHASSTVSSRSIEPSRPPSRRGALVSGKRSSLNRVESVVTTSDVSDGNMIEPKNKSTLSGIVMTAMRMYGLQPKKRYSKSRIELETQKSLLRESSRPPDDEDDYKLIYDRTFKGASFAFRRHLASGIVSQESMRDVVDRLLAIFCNDPLVSHAKTNEFFAESSRDEAPAPDTHDVASASIPLPDSAALPCVSPTGKNGRVFKRESASPSQTA